MTRGWRKGCADETGPAGRAVRRATRPNGLKTAALGMAALFGSLIAACAPAQRGQGPGAALLRFYQQDLNHLSAVRAAECPMFPSCSDYAAQCLEKHGFFVGWMMIADRLMRCGMDETRLGPRVYVEGAWKTYDPVEANDFWWTKRSPLTRFPDQEAGGPGQARAAVKDHARSVP